MSEEKESLLSALLRAQRCLMYGGLGRLGVVVAAVR